METLALVLVLVFVMLVIFLILHFKHGGKVMTRRPAEQQKKPRFFVRRAVAKKEETMEGIEKRRSKTLDHEERRKLFGLFDTEGVKPERLSYVDLLNKVTKSHELRKIRWEAMQKKERLAVKKMQRMVRRIREEGVAQMTEEEAKNVFERLKKVADEHIR